MQPVECHNGNRTLPYAGVQQQNPTATLHPASPLQQLAAATPNLSGRDLRDVAEHTERRWASGIVRGEREEGSLPSLSEYLESARERLAATHGTPLRPSTPQLGSFYM